MGLNRDVHVEIGALILDGFDRSIDAEVVSAAFTAELTRLVRARGLPVAADVSASTGLPALEPSTSPEGLGVALARSVHAGLSDSAPGRLR
ncbi:hypothetical protein [Paractinoplanes durhamensis]|uniref:Uncharacterized protein n=1 Tax=Paractinoplanes durhamensis TaxID=113563 RepID=A0ABQ3YV11_9ACTN|nr:hypothetical protein [Actinoplanes durhamensis]GIE01438.1 hypothetical protein Adu01nite_27880 [Actinoplanes durhamensis]